MISVAGIIKESVADGAGLRFALYVQGCPRSCPGCHNPSAQPFSGGKEMSPEDIFSEIEKNPLLSGVTFSGGEPFSQSAALVPLAKLIKGKGLHLAAYTGNTFEELLTGGDAAQKELLGLLDVLVDGEYLENERDLALRFRGSKNQRILDVPKSLAAGKAVETAWQGIFSDL